MKDDQILRKATQLIERRKYGDSIRLLEPEVVRYHDSFRFYYLLGNACLRSGDFGGALTYFRRAREIKMTDSGVLLGLAVLYLRRGDTDRSVELYLEVLEKDPKNSRALRSLQVIRKNGDPETLSTYIESGRIEKLYPPIPKLPVSVARIVTGIGLIAAGLSVLLVVSSLLHIIPGKTNLTASRPGIDTVRLENEDKKSAVELGGASRYVLTKQQVLAEFESARRLFLEYRDEAARVRLNRLLESNAAVSIKQKARLLSEYAAVPGFDTIKDRFPYATVLKEPPLYRDVHVIWRGMATNLKEADRSTAFELLVGYDTRSTLEGIVPVHFDFAIPVDVERPIEVLGRISLSGDKIRLVGISIHQASSTTIKLGETAK